MGRLGKREQAWKARKEDVKSQVQQVGGQEGIEMQQVRRGEGHLGKRKSGQAWEGRKVQRILLGQPEQD